MKKNVIFLFALAALLLFAGGRTAHALSTEPYVTWDPQSVQYPVGADAEYSATVSGKNLEFTWYVEYGGKEYEIPKDMDALMNAGMKNDCDGIDHLQKHQDRDRYQQRKTHQSILLRF